MQLHIGIDEELHEKLINDLDAFNKKQSLNLSISQYVAMLIKRGMEK